MTTDRPDTALRDAEIRGAVFDWLLDTYGAHVDIRVTDVDALFAGPLADLARALTPDTRSTP